MSDSGHIIRRVKVDCTRTPQKALEATGRVWHIDPGILDGVPRATAEEAEILFFQVILTELNSYRWPVEGDYRFISNDELQKEYAVRGLKPVDLITLAAANDDPSFADTIPHGTHWRGVDGGWCMAAFDSCDDGRGVFVRHAVIDWRGRGWFAGICV